MLILCAKSKHVRLGTKYVTFPPNGTFLDQISVKKFNEPKCTESLTENLTAEKKCTELWSEIVNSLTHLGPKSHIPDLCCPDVYSRDATFGIQIESDWPTNGTNLGLFKISLYTFWLAEPKRTETDLKKSQMCPL